MFREANRGNLLINPTWETFWYKMLLKELESLDSFSRGGTRPIRARCGGVGLLVVSV